jgi:hypothetical protein
MVRRVLDHVSGQIHQARLAAVTAGVVGLIRGGCVALTALGRAMAHAGTSAKHAIKRSDRLLGNPTLFAELVPIYRSVARVALRGIANPVLLVDWTESGTGMCTLTAAVAAKGRAVPIYSTTCVVAKAGSAQIERAFIEELASLLPPGCIPTVVTDAGFKSRWIQTLHARGWNFVARVRGRTLVQRLGTSTWGRCKMLFAEARRRPRSLGDYTVVRGNPYSARLITVDQRSTSAKRPTTTKRRAIRRQKAARAAREPWLLATSLSSSAHTVVEIYALRMQIELTFRDTKSRRFGWGLEHAGCRSPKRVAVQIMLIALASVVAMNVGERAEAAGLHRRFQANTTTCRRVLSLIYLGVSVIRSPDAPALLRGLTGQPQKRGDP